MADEQIKCFFCRRSVEGYVKELSRHVNWHIRKGELSPDFCFFDCTIGQCQMRYQNLSSLKRHIIHNHPRNGTVPDNVDEDDNINDLQQQDVEEIEEGSPDTPLTLDDIKKAAALSICRLTADAGLPQSRVSDTVKICENIIWQVSEYFESQTKTFLVENNIDVDSDSTRRFLNVFKDLDLFKEVKTYPRRKAFVEKLAVEIPKPVSKCVGTRKAIRHVNGLAKPVTVNETFTYVPIIETLKLIFRDPRNRSLLVHGEATQETPGVREYSSFKTGKLYESSRIRHKRNVKVRAKMQQKVTNEVRVEIKLKKRYYCKRKT